MLNKVLVSGIQASGRLHIGNYFGAMKQNVDLTNSGDYESYIFIADYHSMTTLTNANERRQNSFDLACAYLACGLDPTKVILFKQSDVPEHTELSWILSTLTPLPMLMLAHSLKDRQNITLKNFEELSMEKRVKLNLYNIIQETEDSFLHREEDPAIFTERSNFVDTFYNTLIEEQKERLSLKELLVETRFGTINAGLFTYPVLMAADILMYNANLVPVGKDQEQHIEIAREIAGKFNRAYSEFFTMPQAHILKEVAIVPGTDGNKMSKSKGNIIPLFGTDEEIKKAVINIVTDSARPEDKKNPDENNIYKIHKLFLNEDENTALRARYEEGGLGYKEAKEMLLEKVLEFIAPHREKYDYYQTHPDEVTAILHDGAMKASAKAKETMKEVRRIVGLY